MYVVVGSDFCLLTDRNRLISSSHHAIPNGLYVCYSPMKLSMLSL